jgi:hypothetical protein
MTTVVTYRVLLREGESSDYRHERTSKSLIPPDPEGGPYGTQEAGEVFLVDKIEGGTIYGRLV